MIPESTHSRKPALPAGRAFFDRLLVPTIVVLVGLAAFGLGRLSALTELQTGIVVHQPGEATQD